MVRVQGLGLGLGQGSCLRWGGVPCQGQEVQERIRVKRYKSFDEEGGVGFRFIG